MKLIITIDIDADESGLSEDSIKDNIVGFARDLLIIGAAEQDIGITLRKVEYSV